MKGMFVNDNGCIHYAILLARGVKTIETRSRNMLSALIGERVAIVRTHRGKAPHIVGYCTITGSKFCKAEDFDKYFSEHYVSSQSKYAPDGTGKWFYFCSDAESCDPFPLPADAIRHGRSWCEL